MQSDTTRGLGLGLVWVCFMVWMWLTIDYFSNLNVCNFLVCLSMKVSLLEYLIFKIFELLVWDPQQQQAIRTSSPAEARERISQSDLGNPIGRIAIQPCETISAGTSSAQLNRIISQMTSQPILLQNLRPVQKQRH